VLPYERTPFDAEISFSKRGLKARKARRLVFTPGSMQPVYTDGYELRENIGKPVKVQGASVAFELPATVMQWDMLSDIIRIGISAEGVLRIVMAEGIVLYTMSC
jgi:hypothetical protein